MHDNVLYYVHTYSDMQPVTQSLIFYLPVTEMHKIVPVAYGRPVN